MITSLRSIVVISRSVLAGIAALALASCSVTARPRGTGVADRIARIEQGLLPTTRVANRSHTAATIEARMAATGVPAVSIAVVNGGRIEWAKAYHTYPEMAAARGRSRSRWTVGDCWRRSPAEPPSSSYRRERISSCLSWTPLRFASSVIPAANVTALVVGSARLAR